MRQKLNIAALVGSIALVLIMTAASCGMMIPDMRTQQGKDKTPIVIDLTNIDASLQLKGSLVARASDSTVTELVFTIANTDGATPINLSDGSLHIGYRDSYQQIDDLPWSWQVQGDHDQDSLLEEGELVQLTVPLLGALKTPLGLDTNFIIEVSPPQDVGLTILGTTPSQLDPITDLN